MNQILKKLFGGSKQEKVLQKLAQQIVHTSYILSSKAMDEMEELKDVSLFRMTLGLSEALISATDRIAHGMKLDNRYESMEILIDEICKLIVDMFMSKSQLSANEGVERIKSEIHTAHLYLGQFPVESTDGTLKGTFAWEMSKMVAKDMDLENDIAIMSIIQDFYQIILTDVNPKSYLLKL
jgi:hypothetical protein